MTNRRHFYSFKINQNASAQNFSQNPPCPDKPGKPLFLRIHAVRHNNAFCNGHPASRFCCRIAPKLRLRGTKMLPFFAKLTRHQLPATDCPEAPTARHEDVAFFAKLIRHQLPATDCPEAPTARHENVAFFAKLTRHQLPATECPETPTARHEDVALLQNSPGIKNISRREFWGCFSKAQ